MFHIVPFSPTTSQNIDYQHFKCDKSSKQQGILLTKKKRMLKTACAKDDCLSIKMTKDIFLNFCLKLGTQDFISSLAVKNITGIDDR